MDRIRYEYIRGSAYVTSFDDEAGENRLRWFGNVQRKRTLRRFPGFAMHNPTTHNFLCHWCAQ